MASRIFVVLRVVSDQNIQRADRGDGTARDLLFADALSCHRSHFHFLLRRRGLLSGTQGHARASRRNHQGRVVTEIALQTVKLVRRVQGIVSHTLVDGIDLSVAKGEFLAITGPSGSGKSSLLYLLGLLDAPPNGAVIICGQATSKLAETERADVRLTKCGFVFQFHFLLPEFTALENVLLPMRAYGRMSTKEMNEKAMSLLASLGLGEQTGKRPNQLSGGQRQRVALARALANRPEIIVADEPTGNLDTASTEQVFGILRDIADSGQTVVVVTPDAALAARADRRTHIVDAKIHETTFGGDRKREIIAVPTAAECQW